MKLRKAYVRPSRRQVLRYATLLHYGTVIFAYCYAMHTSYVQVSATVITLHLFFCTFENILS